MRESCSPLPAGAEERRKEIQRRVVVSKALQHEEMRRPLRRARRAERRGASLAAVSCSSFASSDSTDDSWVRDHPSGLTSREAD